jgi:hypothetical protein
MGDEISFEYCMYMYDQEQYNEGARTILVKDVGPQGCGPFWLTYFSHTANDPTISISTGAQFHTMTQ